MPVIFVFVNLGGLRVQDILSTSTTIPERVCTFIAEIDPPLPPPLPESY